MPAHRRPSSMRAVMLPLGALVAAACAPAAPSEAPHAQAPAWIDAPLAGASQREAEALATLATGDLHAHQVYLDRVLDLLDAARFAQDDDARETLWDALGGHPTGVGPAATRDAATRILEHALVLEDEVRRAASPEVGEFAADVINLVTTDLQAVGSAEDLSLRTLVYRTLVDQGHPRIADNARWRLYDHARGTLAGAVDVPPVQRLDVAVQALYVDRDSVEEFLADTAPHARPAWPSADTLWTTVDTQLDALGEQSRWAAVVEHRRREDHQLHETVQLALPAPRSADWPLASLPAGTARAEQHAPVVRIADGQLIADAGRPHARRLPIADDQIVELSRAVGNAVAPDGRGTVLLVADPMLPAPAVRTTMRALFRAQTQQIELAVREPRLARDAGEVVVALPLHVTHAGGQRPGDRAWQRARVHLHLDGRGATMAIDDHWLRRPATDTELRQQIQTAARAYPTERGVRISLGPDVQLRQLLDLLVALHGGPARPFAAVGWFADGTRPGSEHQDGDALLARRASLAWPSVDAELSQAYPLKDTDQARLEGFAEQLAVCLPELSPKKPRPSVDVTLRFEEGRLRETTIADTKKLPRANVEAATDCIEQEAYALRLRNHREGLSVEVHLQPSSPRAVP